MIKKPEDGKSESNESIAQTIARTAKESVDAFFKPIKDAISKG